MSIPSTALQLRSLIQSSGELQLSLASVPVPTPGDHEVLIRVEAAPLNPSDQGLLFGAADLASARASGTAEQPVITAKVPAGAMKAMAGRMDQSMPVGNEGAGLVVAAGAAPAAHQLGAERRTAFRRGAGPVSRAAAIAVRQPAEEQRRLHGHEHRVLNRAARACRRAYTDRRPTLAPTGAHRSPPCPSPAPPCSCAR